MKTTPNPRRRRKQTSSSRALAKWRKKYSKTWLEAVSLVAADNDLNFNGNVTNNAGLTGDITANTGPFYDFGSFSFGDDSSNQGGSDYTVPTVPDFYVGDQAPSLQDQQFMGEYKGALNPDGTGVLPPPPDPNGPWIGPATNPGTPDSGGEPGEDPNMEPSGIKDGLDNWARQQEYQQDYPDPAVAAGDAVAQNTQALLPSDLLHKSLLHSGPPPLENFAKMFAGIPPVTNISGVWKFDSADSRVTRSGAAITAMTLVSPKGGLAVLGIMKSASHGLTGLALHIAKDGTRRAVLLPLPKADAFCLELDSDSKTGQVTFWINEAGWDMGRLGFNGGGWGAFVGRTMHPHDHLLSGQFAECAVARNGRWQSCDFTQPLATLRTVKQLSPYHEHGHPEANTIRTRDLRTAVA